MSRLIKNKKALSHIIATFLLIGIAVAAAALVYSWTMGYLEATTATTAPTQGQLSIEKVVNLAGGATQLTISVRNTGMKSVMVDTIYITDINGTQIGALKKGTGSGSWSATGDGAIGNGGLTVDFTIRLPAQYTIVSAHTYTFKIVCTDDTTSTATYTAS